MNIRALILDHQLLKTSKIKRSARASPGNSWQLSESTVPGAMSILALNIRILRRSGQITEQPFLGWPRASSKAARYIATHLSTGQVIQLNIEWRPAHNTTLYALSARPAFAVFSSGISRRERV